MNSVIVSKAKNFTVVIDLMELISGSFLSYQDFIILIHSRILLNKERIKHLIFGMEKWITSVNPVPDSFD